MLKIFLGNTVENCNGSDSKGLVSYPDIVTYSSLKRDGVHRKAMTLIGTSRNTLKMVTRKIVLTFRIN